MADFWDGLAGDAPPAGGDMASQIADLYAQAGRPPPSAAEIAANSQNPGGLPAVAALLQSDNAKAMNAANPPPAATGNMFGAIPAAFAPSASTDFTPQQMRTDYIAPQFSEAAPTFTAPTAVTDENDPGYQFRIQQAQQGVERSAAARGTVLNPGTVSALAQRVGDQATSEFSNVYNRASNTFQNNLATYGAKYNVFAGNAGLKQQEFTTNNAAIGANNTANASAAQQRFGNQATTYGVNAAVTEQAQTDYWNRLMDQARLGASSAAA